MNLRTYIALIWLMLTASGGTLRAQQYMGIVCAGDTGVAYYVQGTAGSTFNWTVSGGMVVRNYGDSIIVNWGTVAGEYDLRVQEVSKYGCPAAPVGGKVLVSAPTLELGDDKEICDGEVIEILPVGLFSSYLWHDGSKAPNYIGRVEETIGLTVTDKYGCKSFDDMFLEVHPLPYVNLGMDTSLCGIETLVLDAGGNGQVYDWSTGESTREITVSAGYQKITASVMDQYGCSSGDTIVINSCSTSDYFKNMPSAFTPNGDGKNDVWGIPQLQSFPQAVVEVYDRWGTLVFRSERGYSNPWDGNTGSKQMPMDSYYFIINLNSPGLESISGTVTVIK